MNNAVISAEISSLIEIVNILSDVTKKAAIKLKNIVESYSEDDKWQENWNKNFGVKETISSMAIKLTNNIQKIISLYKKISQPIDNKPEIEKAPLNIGPIERSKAVADIANMLKRKEEETIFSNNYKKLNILAKTPYRMPVIKG